jgi:hypothetical protein
LGYVDLLATSWDAREGFRGEGMLCVERSGEEWRGVERSGEEGRGVEGEDKNKGEGGSKEISEGTLRYGAGILKVRREPGDERIARCVVN